MRIVTRPDFDGIVCAVLLYETTDITITEPIKWTQPGQMQKRQVPILKGDIIANLPFHENCTLWFDHHYSNQPQIPFEGAFRIAPSAAGLICDYYHGKFNPDLIHLVKMADKIDSADLTKDEVSHPEKDPYILLSMTINGREAADEPYWNHVVDLLRTTDIKGVMADTEVSRRCRQLMDINRQYRQLLLDHTRIESQVAITDFRSLQLVPDGNRFLVYVLFQEAGVSIRICHDRQIPGNIAVNVAHSIFNPHCRVNVGHMLSQFEGGGHAGAGATTFHNNKADEYIPRIIDILVRNEPNQ